MHRSTSRGASRWCGRLSQIACVAAAIAVSLFTPAVASANGRFPASNEFFFSPTDANVIVLRTTFGIMISRDGGGSWVWLCEDALGLSSVSSEDPTLGLTANGSMVVGVSWALQVSPDMGCTWNVEGAPVMGKDFIDLAVRPDNPHAIVALQSSYTLDAGVGGGTGYVNQLFESTDDGATWSPLGVPIDPSVVATTVDVAATDPHRVYVSGYRLATEAGPANASLFVSMTDGASWSEQPLPALDTPSETGVFIGAVDPTNADIVYLRSGKSALAMAPSRLFVTRNAGASFQVALTLKGQMLGFALSPDGTNLYVGGPNDGLLTAPTSSVGSTNQFTAVNPNLIVQCLAMHGTDLWACSNEASGFIAGLSTNAGSTFAPKLHLVDVQTPIQCEDGDAAGAQCSGTPFTLLCRMFGNCPMPDGGPPGPGLDSGNPPGNDGAASGSGGGSGGSSGGSGSGGSSGASSGGGSGSSSSGGGFAPPSSGGGCSVLGGGAAAGFAVGFMGVAAIIARRRRATRQMHMK